MKCRFCHIGLGYLAFFWPKMDGKLFPLRDSRWARLMDYEVNERYAPEVHLAAVTDQVLWQVIRGLDL